MLWIVENLNEVSFAEVSPFLPRLSEARRERILEAKSEPYKVQSAAAELLLRLALREEYGITELPTIWVRPRGKPYFEGHTEVQFNLSHCKTAVAAALDDRELGVDVQECQDLMRRQGRPAGDSKLPALFRIMSDPEQRWILEAEDLVDQDRRFTAVWTCKEAYGKAVGRGILYHLHSKTFLPRPEPWQQDGFTFQCIDLGSTFATLCAAKALPVKRMSLRELLSVISEEIP